MTKVSSAFSSNYIDERLSKLYKQSQRKLKSLKKTQSPLQWFIQEVIAFDDPKIPRLLLLKKSFQALHDFLPDKKQLNFIILEEAGISSVIFEAKNLIDIAFILQQHLNSKAIQKRIQYGSIIMDSLDNKIASMLNNKKGNLHSFLRVNTVFDFIDYKMENSKQVFNRICDEQLSQLRAEIALIFNYLIKPWIQKTQPKMYYEQLCVLVYWLLIIEDGDSPQTEELVFNLGYLINMFFCRNKQSDDSFTFLKVFNLMMDVLSINYRKEDPFKTYELAILCNQFENEISKNSVCVSNWLQSRGKRLKSTQIQNIFRNTYHIGSNIFLFHIIDQFSQFLKRQKQYEVLYHLFLSYIKKDYLDIVLPNHTFIQKYIQILTFYAVGFINRDRLDGESELDRLTNNISITLLRKKNANLSDSAYHLIMFYKIYEVRFSRLSSYSKQFLSDLQHLYKQRSNIELSRIHQYIHQNAFRQAGLDNQMDYGDAFQQLNIKKTDRYRGMMNLGNTCYMNSFMQALFMTKKFRTTVFAIRDEKQLPSDRLMSYELINLFTEMSTKTISKNDNQIMPDRFKGLAPEPFKSSWEQHDVGEFGRIYLQSITSQLGKDQTKGTFDKNKKRIEKIFFNKIEKKLICERCKKEKANSELVLDLILHLKKQDREILISKLLSDYFLGEDISGDNKVYCQKCKKNTQQVAIPHPVKLAEYLIITIGLFEYGPTGGKKIKKPFNFQFNINFHQILQNNKNIVDQNYDLYAFIVHIGNESERGHYICYARNLQQNPTLWYCFDDGYVTEREIQNVSEFQFGQSETPYMLFYSTSRRRNSISQSLIFSRLGKKHSMDFSHIG